MAFACCVRKSATKLASVCGRVRSISAVMNHPSLDFNPSPMSPFVSRGFFNSMAVDKLSPEQSLHLVIDSELNSALQTDDPNLEQNEEMAPGSFPFKIRDKPGDQSVTLTAYYNDEHIHIDVGMPYLGDDVIDVFGPSNDELSFPLVVTVTKKNAVRIEFTCNAYADYIDLTDLTVHDYPFPMGETDWPRFKNLDDNLKKAFHRYLATRLEASITKLLHKYMVGKTKREYLLWLKNVKKFVDG